MSSFDKIFEKQFGTKLDDTIPKRDLTEKKEPKPKRLKRESFIPIRVYDENTQTYHVYFIRYDLKKNKTILREFRKKIIDIEFNDLVKIEELEDFVNQFTKDDAEKIKQFCDMNSDIFTHVGFKGKLSGKLLKDMNKREKEEEEENEEEENNNDTMTEWLQKKLINKTFIERL